LFFFFVDKIVSFFFLPLENTLNASSDFSFQKQLGQKKKKKRPSDAKPNKIG